LPIALVGAAALLGVVRAVVRRRQAQPGDAAADVTQPPSTDLAAEETGPPEGAEAGEFDDDALAVAHLARSFARHGIEPRHLKMYKHFAEREAALYESVVMPLLRQRNPQARRQAQEVVAELARLGRALRTAMLRSSLQGPLGE
jgi:hypothetical protein